MARTIEFLRSIEIEQEVGLLASEIGLQHYVNGDLQGVVPWDRLPEETFFEFIRRRDIGLIVEESQLRHDTRLKNDPDLAALLKAPGRFGFVLKEIPGTNRRLLIRSDLQG